MDLMCLAVYMCADWITVNLFNCIFGCQGFIVDNLKLTDIVDKKCPRLNQYDMATLMRAIRQAKRYHGRISFDNFEVLIISLS